MSASDTPSNRRQLPRALASLRIFSRRLLPRELGAMLPTLGSADPKIPELAVVDPDSDFDSGEVHMVTTNISTGGINATGDLDLSGRKLLAVGEDLVLEIEFPDGQGRLKAIARVMWSSERQDNHRAGLIFVAISEDSIQRIRNFMLIQGVQPPKGGPLHG